MKHQDATFTVIMNQDGEWQVQRQTGDTRFVSEATFPTVLHAVWHASQRAQNFFPAKVDLSQAQVKQVKLSLNDPYWDAWRAAGMPVLETDWSGDYSNVYEASGREDYVGM
jgi:hypothetical protein